MKNINKKRRINKFLFSLMPLAAGTILLSASCQQQKSTNEKTKVDQFIDPSVNRDNSLIGEELARRVSEVLQNVSFTFTDFAKNEYNQKSNDIEKDNYIRDLWEKMTEWFSEHEGIDNRYNFLPEDLKNEEFNKYLNVYIPNLEYFAGNHEVHCYFAYDSETRNIYYYFKIKCLDGKQTEGSGTVYLALPNK
ncbi:hypothetical protein V2E25_02980 [Mycoplasmopsis arginini]|uniref:Lipoprotein n=1 Tax=Mycoplasmopsis arginini TaxID=2094 RepID=A0ABZ2AK63_MYCAR|nr:hypothetical protein [Mycoplasmopsis arginini]WVN21920.1 hypothetical protein V2E25_02980 [Mycoplasmopsis arginini]